MTTGEIRITDNLEELLNIIPEPVKSSLRRLEGLNDLIEVVMDLGRKPEARFPNHMTYLKDDFVTRKEIDYVVERVGKFGEDNRAGIERTLHRISAIRNRTQDVIGLTLRVGRAVYGTIALINDLLGPNNSILLLGRPGVGKTTMLREMARVLADDLEKRVVIVDTSNEIAGDGDIPHSGIGLARRMQVPHHELQHEVMIEAVQNHMPEVIVVDEIGTEKEAYAARTIAERGVQLIATAHGNTLENLLMNPTLSDLVGGIQAVTLSDEEARKRHTQKTVLERKAPPTFDIVIEIQEKDRLALHRNMSEIIDMMLRGHPPQAEIRERDENNGYKVVQESDLYRVSRKIKGKGNPSGNRNGSGHGNGNGFAMTSPRPSPWAQGRGKKKGLSIYPYAVSRNRIEKAIESLEIPARVVRRLEEADVILTLKSQSQKGSKKLREMAGNALAIHTVRSNTVTQIENLLREIYQVRPGGTSPEVIEEEALKEAESAAREVLRTSSPRELLPRNSYLRRLQHQIVEQEGAKSRSTGKEPYRRVQIYLERVEE